jgi:methylmalonyl-CoA mutase
METGYQRSKIQEESLHYERLKHSGEHPLVGVNTFLDPHRGANVLEARELTRSTPEEKDARLAHLQDFQQRHSQQGLWGASRPGGTARAFPGAQSIPAANATSSRLERVPNPGLDGLPAWQRPSSYSLARLQHTARTGGNLFAELLQTVCSCSLGQITHAFYEVGGQYRRSM